MPQAILHRRDVEGIGRRRWTKAHRQQAGTATTAAASLDRGTHLVETGSSGGNAAALWCGNWAEEARMESPSRVGGGRYFIYRPPPFGSSTYSPDFKSMLPDLVVFLVTGMDRAAALLQGAGGLAAGFSGVRGGRRFQQGRARPVLTVSLLFRRAALWRSSMATVLQLLHSYKAGSGGARRAASSASERTPQGAQGYRPAMPYRKRPTESSVGLWKNGRCISVRSGGRRTPWVDSIPPAGLQLDLQKDFR